MFPWVREGRGVVWRPPESLLLSLLAEARLSPLPLCPQRLAHGGFSVNIY